MTKKEQILEYFKDINVAYNNSTMLDTLKHMLEDLEEVRPGHWIQEWEDADGWWLRCSNCEMVFYVGKGRQGNYCPNCGAKMDESTMGQVKPSDKEFTLYADKKPIVTFKDSKIVLHGERKEDVSN